jgi:hypothetical protein
VINNAERLVSKRVFVTLPDLAYDKLERWADSQGRPVANLAAFLLETALNEAEEEGKIPLKKDPPASGTGGSGGKGRGKKGGE